MSVSNVGVRAYRSSESGPALSCRHDPDHARTWIALVDGNNHQIDTIRSDAATYLIHKASCLDYPTALHNSWPITTGVIDEACRHLVKDRMASPEPAGDCPARSHPQTPSPAQ